MTVDPQLAASVARIESHGLPCVLGMRFCFEAQTDARKHAAAIRSMIDSLERPELLSRIEYRHRDDVSSEPLTPKKLAQLGRWLAGPWRHEVLHVHLSSASGATAFGLCLPKPPEQTELPVVYAAWPAVWASERLTELERAFFRVLETGGVRFAHLGPMMVAEATWPGGASLDDVQRRPIEACAEDPEWEVLDETYVHGLTSVSWWTYLGDGVVPGPADGVHELGVGGGRALRASASPFGADAARGQARVFAALEEQIVSAALDGTLREIERIARHERGRGRLARAVALYHAQREASAAAFGATTAVGWDRARRRYVEIAAELGALGLPTQSAGGRSTWAHPAEARGLLPTIPHRAPASVPATQLANAYTEAWRELQGDLRDRHGTLLRASMLAIVTGLGAPARRDSWQGQDVFRNIELGGALPVLFEAGGRAAVESYLEAATKLAPEHPVLHHALARIHAAEGRRDLVARHVEAAAHAGYEHASMLEHDDALGLSAPPEPVAGPDALEPAEVVFAGPSMVLVLHPTRGRFTFRCKGAGCARGDAVRIGGFDGIKARFLELGSRLHEEW